MAGIHGRRARAFLAAAALAAGLWACGGGGGDGRDAGQDAPPADVADDGLPDGAGDPGRDAPQDPGPADPGQDSQPSEIPGDDASDPGPDPVPGDLPPDGADLAGDPGADVPAGQCDGTPGGAFCPCATGEDCLSEICIDTMEGGVCAKPCVTDCPQGWACRTLGGRDPVSICVPAFHPALCRPCAKDDDCGAAGQAAPAKCLAYGALEGSFCGSDCGSGAGCPEGFDCLDGQCRPASGECLCRDSTEGRETPCSRANAQGTCRGVRQCSGGVLTGCSAPEAAAESCNLADDDCDDRVDEDLGTEPCGQGPCRRDVPRCVAGQPGTCDPFQGAVAETCNGIDDDCDGGPDEGFVDGDGDLQADCVDPDDDGDGVPDDGNGSGNPLDAPCGPGQSAGCDDNCPLAANPGQADLDADGKGDACDNDQDGDGALGAAAGGPDCDDRDPGRKPGLAETCDGIDQDCDGRVDEDFPDLDGDGTADCLDPDDDGDGADDPADNCPQAANPGQADQDGDGLGDACDGDRDGDGVLDAADNCPTVANGDQRNTDLQPDGGDACDADDDQDGAADADDCAPLDPAFHPGRAELCDGLDQDCDDAVDEGFPDTDRDGQANCVDADDDGDGIPDDGDGSGNPLDAPCLPGQSAGCDDNCGLVPNGDQKDLDADGKGDACDPDQDGDGRAGTAVGGDDCNDRDATVSPAVNEAPGGTPGTCNGRDDDCDNQADEGFGDVDKDGQADCVDADDDGDGILDDGDGSGTAGDGTCKAGATAGCDDNCPVVSNGSQADTDGDGVGDACESDSDNDGWPDATDNCPVVFNPTQANTDGLADGGDACDGDDDQDGTADADDCQPLDPAVHPGADEACNGRDDDCDGAKDEGFADSDDDGVADCIDGDRDGDGWPDGADNCPAAFNPTQVNTDGLPDGGDACDGDDDQDGSPDGLDCRPLDPAYFPGATELCDGRDEDCNGLADDPFPDTDRDGTADCMEVDDDADGIVDALDNCPRDANFDQADLDGDLAGDACDPDDDGDGTCDIGGPVEGACVRGEPWGFDNCPRLADPDLTDTDLDGYGDACDDDDDADLIPDAQDNCPKVRDFQALDFDGDGLGDACDPDMDDDTVPNATDTCPKYDDRIDSDGDRIPDACEILFAGHVWPVNGAQGTAGQPFEVFIQLWKAGVTNLAGPAPGIEVRFRYRIQGDAAWQESYAAFNKDFWFVDDKGLNGYNEEQRATVPADFTARGGTLEVDFVPVDLTGGAGYEHPYNNGPIYDQGWKAGQAKDAAPFLYPLR